MDETLPKFGIIAQQPGGKAKTGIVGFKNGRIKAVDPDDLQDRPKQFLVRAVLYIGHVNQTRCQERAGRIGTRHFADDFATIGNKFCLCRDKAIGRPVGNHRPHKGFGINIWRTDNQPVAIVIDRGDHRIATCAGWHDQAARAGATLPCGDKGRHDGMVGDGIEIGGVPDDKWIIPAKFEGQDFVHLPGKGMVQMASGRDTAGKEQPVDTGMLRHGNAGIAFALHKVQNPARQSGPLPELYGFPGDKRG